MSLNFKKQKNKNYLTKEGFEKIKAELNYLKTEKRREIAKRLNETSSHGDLKENAAYHEAKEAQSFLEGKIRELENILADVEIVQKKESGRVEIGSTVLIKETTDNSEEEKFKIVGSAAETDPFKGIVSLDSPLGKSLINKKVGDVLKVKTPEGKIEYKIIKIE